MPGKADEFDLSDYKRPTDSVNVSQADALLPDLKSEYKAAGVADRREVPRLAVVFGKERFRAGQVAYMAFQYTDIGVGECEFTETGYCLRFPFHDAIQPKLLVIKGRNLLRIFDQISLRRLPWIRQAERDVRLPDDEPIITWIDIQDRRAEQGTPARVLEFHQA